MRSIVLTISILLSSIFTLSAQQDGGSLSLSKYKEEREKFLIREVGLTETEAKIFIPLTNDLLKKKYDLNRQARQELGRILKKERLTDADYLEIVDKNIEIKQKEAQLEKEYYLKFKKILPPEKLYKYQKAEMQFMRMAVKRASNRE